LAGFQVTTIGRFWVTAEAGVGESRVRPRSAIGAMLLFHPCRSLTEYES